MNHVTRLASTTGLGLAVVMGCSAKNAVVNAPAPLGAEIDQMMMQQEMNAEAAKFVVYMHEFELNRVDLQGREHGWRLNDDGEDHVKQIAAQIHNGVSYPVVIERNRTSVKPGTDFEYPVHLDESLDERRRMVVVASLQRMGIADAEDRVVVAPAFSEGYTGPEAARAYNIGINGMQGQGNGFGGGFGAGSSGGFGGGFF